MKQEDGVFPQGPNTAWATPNGMEAEVRLEVAGGYRVVRRFKGETAYQKAVRYAGDKNSEVQRADRA